jgi:3-hydroxybutyryl-CoA dehydrogenase
VEKRQRIYIFGESPLVEEYASLCLNRGFDVQVRINSDVKIAKLPKAVQRVARPTKACDIALELTNIAIEAKKKNLIELDRVLGPKVPLVSSSVCVTVAEQSGWIKHPGRLVGVGALPSLLGNGLIELAASSSTNEMTLNAAREFIRALGKESAVVQDSVGLVLPRVLCSLINEACFAMMEGVAVGRDIDTAMKLGTNYPLGPVEWADRIGIRNVHAVMRALHEGFDEDRYRAAPLLKRASVSGVLPVS